MSKFLKKILFFILPFLVIAIPLDFLISFGLSKNNTAAHGELKTWTELYSGKINAELLIYGSSRACHHINPITIEQRSNKSTYNLGIQGHNFGLQYFRHKEYLKQYAKPKYIIISVGSMTFRENSGLYNKEQFLPFMLWNSSMYNDLNSYKGFSKKDYFIPLSRYAGNYLSIFKSIKGLAKDYNTNEARQKGFIAHDWKWSNDLKKIRKNRKEYTIPIDSSLVDLFNSFIKEIKSFNSKLIIVYTPEYVEAQYFMKNKKNIQNIFDSFAQEYDLIFLDYSKDEICNSKKYFYNGMHLNLEGTKIFNQKLIDDLIKTNEQHGIFDNIN